VIRRPEMTRLSEWERAKNAAVKEAQRDPFNTTPAPNSTIAPDRRPLEDLLESKGYGKAAAGD